MISYATITPNRGSERKLLFEFCIQQLKKMNGDKPPMNAYIMNDPPKSAAVDLVPRIRQGVELAKKDGFEWVVILESDDCYKSDHFQRYEPYFSKVDFIGDAQSYYYNIKTLRWSLFKHAGRASLFTTAFRISALKDFEWPSDDSKFLDISIWKYARNKKKAFVNSGAIGIKHGQGLVGGKGHVMKLNNADPKREWLKSRIEDYQYEFYKNLVL